MSQDLHPPTCSQQTNLATTFVNFIIAVKDNEKDKDKEITNNICHHLIITIKDKDKVLQFRKDVRKVRIESNTTVTNDAIALMFS